MRPHYLSRLLLLTSLFLASCGPLTGGIPGNPTINPTQQPAATLTTQPAAMPTLPASTATPPLAPTPTPPPTAAPTETPRPVFNLSVPESWHERSVEALKQYALREADILIQLDSDEGADIQLVNEDGTRTVMREAIALAVPFTSSWHAIGLDEALAVLSNGHDQIAVMPWSEMPLGMKALRVDGWLPADSDYPLTNEWSLRAAPGSEDAARRLLPFLTAESADTVVHLVAVGDIMLDRSLGTTIENGNHEYPFAQVAEHLRRGDITVGNIESALGDTGEAVGKRYPFRAPPGAAESLALAGFDIVSLANNHAGDYGSEALLQGMSLLRAQGIAPIGAGANAEEAHAPTLSEVNGLKLAFFSYVHVPIEASTGFDTASWTAVGDMPGIAWADPEVIGADVATVQTQADLTVVVLHSGFEYIAAPSEPQKAAAYAAIDAGADLVIGHHAHILQGIEFYGDGAIIYGTGNFAFEIDGPPETAIFDIWLDEEGVRQIEITPAIIQFGGQPRLVESWEDIDILGQVYHLSNILNAE